MSSDREDVGARMQATRQPTGRTQSKAAALTGISFGAYKNYEAGKRELPSSVAVRFAEEFHINLVWLLTGKGQPNMVNYEDQVEQTSKACFELAARSPERYSPESFGYFCRYVFNQVIEKRSDAKQEAAAADRLIR